MRATIFFLTFAVFTATVVWRVDQVMFGDKLAWGEAQARAQMSAISKALEVKVSGLRNIILLSFSEVELAKKDFGGNKAYSEFQMMARLLPPNLKEDRKDWQLISTFFQENSPAKKWATAYITLALKSVRESEIKSASVHVFSLMDPSRKPYLLLLTRGGANWYAGLMGIEAFQGLMDRQKGQKSTVFVVNPQGQALGHTTQEYVGSLLTEDPLVAEMIKANVGSGYGIFRDLRGESIQGLYEQVDNTNLFAVITTPIQAMTANRDSVRWQLVLMGFGLGLIGLAVFVLNDRSQPRQRPPPHLAGAAASEVPAAVTSSQVTTGQEKMKAYTHVASSLSLELRSPLASILGHTHLALNQVQDAGVQAHLRKIEEEARTAREMVQKLLIFSGQDKFTTQTASLETVLQKALKAVEGKLISKGVRVQKSIQSVPPFTMAGDLVAKAIENLLLNAIEAMERAPKKELSVQLRAEGPDIELIISDSGEGISNSDLPKIFDPFFTTRSGAHHVGLGLSTALGIFKEAFGEVSVVSEKGKGTQVIVTFRPQERLLQQSAPAEVPRKAPVASMSIPEAISAKANDFELTKPIVEAQPASVPAAAAKPRPELQLDPILVDNTIERLIEDDLPDMPPPPRELNAVELVAEQISAQALSSSVTKPVVAQTQGPPKTDFSAKIDKPKIEIKKKASKLDNLQVSVRRPGERV
jgi:two-component system NtrC family sensor kinase